jgi:dTDP-4-dehydrorhamnose reductase
MRILLLGKNGQVGWELQRSLAPLGDVLALDRNSARYCGDLSKPDLLAQTVLAYKPDFIVNAAAHTAVDKAESEPEFAHCLNADAPAALAKAAAEVGAWLVHYSTDYVFDGSGSHARQEVEGTGALSVYGRTKLDGEKAIVASGCKHLIFRTSWVAALCSRA